MSNLSHTYHLKLTVALSIIFIISMNCTHIGWQQSSKLTASSYTEFTYYPNGEKEYTAEYYNGKLDGTSRHWSPDGVLISEAEYSHGKLHGTWEKYYPNENILFETHYFHGQKHGEETWYYENGKVKSEQSFYYGEPSSVIIRWRSDGSIIY